MKVDIFEKRRNIQMQLWVVPGLLFVCCILLAILLNSTSTPLAFPIIALAGMIASHLRTWTGVAIFSAILMLAMLYFLQTQPSSLWIWTIALSLSIAATFVTTALCSDEAYHTWDTLKQDEIDHRQTIIHLNEKVQLLQNRPGHENKEPYSQVNALQEQLYAQEKQRQIDQEKLQASAKQLREYEEKRHFQEEQHQIDQGKLQVFAEQLGEYQEKLDRHEEQRRLVQEKLQAFTDQQKGYEEKLRFHQEQQQIYETKQRAYEDKQRANEQILKLARHEVATAYSNQEKLTQEIEGLQREYEKLKNAQEEQRQQPAEGIVEMRELRRIEGLYQQLRTQFEEKNEVLNATRKELFVTQEKLLAAQKDLEEAPLKNDNATVKSLRQQLVDAEEERIALENQYTSEVQQLHELVDSLMRLSQ